MCVCVCVCIISECLKSGSLLLNSVFRVPDATLLTVAVSCSSNPFLSARTDLSLQEPRRWNLLVLLRKLGTQTKGVEKLNTRNPGKV